MSYAIQAEGLAKSFGATKALKGVDLEARTGTVLGVLGPNGAGKTTAVRILATLLRPDAGRAQVGGYDLVRQAHQVRQLIGLTGQYAAIDEKLTGTENLVMIGRLLGLSGTGAKQRAADLLEQFGLTEAADRKASGYSGGMRRRLDLAASLVGKPGLLYLDEPTTGLDPHSRGELWSTVRSLVAEGTTVLLTTQYLDEADQLADDIAVIDHGGVIANGTPEELKTKIGGQVLDVRPAEAAELPTVTRIVTELLQTQPTVDTDAEFVTGPVNDPAMLAEAVRRFDDAGVIVGELALRRPSLDEVFLSLTGRRATADEAAGNDTDADMGSAA